MGSLNGLGSRLCAALTSRQVDDDVVFVLTTVPFYRVSALGEIGSRLRGRFVIYAGQEQIDPTIETSPVSVAPVNIIEQRFLAGRRLVWQRLPIGVVVRARVALLQLNPRILSTWVILVLRSALGRKTILWGHAFGRSGPHARTKLVRQAQRSLADVLLVYTESEACELRRLSPESLVRAAPNALYYRHQISAVSPQLRTNFVFVGRLVAAKKLDLLVTAFLLARPHLPDDCQLEIVGDGPLRTTLERLAGSTQKNPSVRFHGELTRYDDLRAVYERALASVSPGAVGLSLTQSLGFGVPMIIARDEPHGPEFEAARIGRNTILCDRDDVSALTHALVSVSRSRQIWISRAPTISRECASMYSLEAMADGFLEAVRLAL